MALYVLFTYARIYYTRLFSFSNSIIWLKLSALESQSKFWEQIIAQEYDVLFINNHFLALIPYFLIGSLIYKFNLETRIRDNHLITITSLFIIILLPDKILSFMNPSPIMPILLGCIVILFFKIQKSSVIISFLSNISYSFYLTHFFVLTIVNKMTQINFYSKALFAMCLTIIISYLSYMFIERPCVRFIRKG